MSKSKGMMLIRYFLDELTLDACGYLVLICMHQ